MTMFPRSVTTFRWSVTTLRQKSKRLVVAKRGILSARLFARRRKPRHPPSPPPSASSQLRKRAQRLRTPDCLPSPRLHDLLFSSRRFLARRLVSRERNAVMRFRPAFQDCAVDARNIPTRPSNDSSIRTSFPVKFSIFFRIMGRVWEANGSRIHRRNSVHREVRVRLKRAINPVAFMLLKPVPVRGHIPPGWA